LQDEGWEKSTDSFSSSHKAAERAIQMYTDWPLGESCMYEVRDRDGNRVVANETIVKVAQIAKTVVK
jgi:hypothetical protein